MNNALVMSRVMDGVIAFLRSRCPEVVIVRNDSTEERVIPMVCVTPEAVVREGCEDAWEMRLQVESVQGVAEEASSALAWLAEVSEAMVGLELEGFEVSLVVDTDCNVVIASDSVTYGSVFEFYVSL